ncbi:MAG: regulatory iron-sulfur-containing complex subunit RicT [Desulfobacterales bacterium]|nr:regulatory iron-sulfur-containing complex subunit RicT [Desulfobacterales bacterium]
MKKIAGIQFKTGGKIYDFDCGAFVLNCGDHVMVETEQGLGLGKVVTPPLACDSSRTDQPFKKVFRIAIDKDFVQVEKNIKVESRAYELGCKWIRDLGLKMNLFAVESSFDSKKLTFFFTSEGRIDFRELVKQLVKTFGVKIEIRQVGIRNQAKMCGGLGRCGRVLCCASFMEKFEPVSIRMAKEQGLSLNPTKISGLCGRLMCCLTFENKAYHETAKRFPKIGKTIQAPDGSCGKVLRHNSLGSSFTLLTDEGSEIEIKLDDPGNPNDTQEQS